MQIVPRAFLFSAALLASAPLLAAESDSATADAPAQHATTGPDDCWLPAADFATGLSGLLPRPSRGPDSSGIDKAVSCLRPLTLQKHQPENGGQLQHDHLLTAVPAGTGTSWPRQHSFLESSLGPGTPELQF